MPLEQRINVRAVTKDGADVYDWVARQSFPNATKILDKFHILKWAFNALQYMRIQLKTDHIIQQREREKSFKFNIVLTVNHLRKIRLK
jgi:transposase